MTSVAQARVEQALLVSPAAAPRFYDLDDYSDLGQTAAQPWQFSLRSLFVVVTAGSILAALHASPGLVCGGGAVYLLWEFLHHKSVAQQHVSIAMIASRAAPDKAKMLAQYLIDEYPSYSPGYAIRGRSAMREGRFDEAIDDLSEAVRLEPDSFKHRMQRAAAYYWAGDYERSIRDLNQAVELNPQSAWALVARANSTAMTGQFAAAIADYSRAIELSPKNVVALENRARCHLEVGDLANAIEDCDRAIAQSDSTIEAWCIRGRAKLSQHDHSAALADLNECLRLDSQHAAARYYRAKAEEALGHAEDERADLARAAATEPELARTAPGFEVIPIWLP